jgi:PAS domain S-box-containing protein
MSLALHDRPRTFRMNKTPQISHVLAKGLAVALIGIIFFADCWTPAYINLSIFYACVPVMLALGRSSRWLWIGTSVTVLLTFLDLMNGDGYGQSFTWVETTNRCITAFMLIVMAGFAQFSILLARKFLAQSRLVAEMAQRTEAGLALQESERKYRELVEHANSIIVRWTRDGRITFMNEFGLHFFGFTLKELLGQHVVGTIVPEIESTSRDLRPLMKQILTDPTAFEKNTNENMRRNGERVWIAWTNKTVLDEQGQVQEVLSIGTDITEQRKAEAQIAEQAAFLDKARDAIVARSLEGKVLFWNQGAEIIFGWKREEAVGKNVSEIFSSDLKSLEGINEEMLADGEWSGELRLHARNGREIVLDSRLTLIRDRAGNPKSVLGISTDVTEKKIIEAQFLRAQRMESIGTLAGGIAHDLNNILTPILMSIDTLKTKTFDAQAVKMLESIGVSAKRGADIVRQLLTFARGIQGERVEIKPAHLLRDIELIIKDIFPKDIRLHLSIPEETWTMQGDPTQMHQVLLNLCLNSRDAMPDGGDLHLGVENCEFDERDAAANLQASPGRYVKFSVIDKGTGMPREILDKIFEPFFTTKDINKGTGLGLSTVSAIVKSHGGILNVYSELGTGTIFHIYLPATENLNAAKTGRLPEANLPRGKGETILLVDDEAPILAVTGQILEAFGYRVMSACDGVEALALYVRHQHEIDLVLTDMRMPVMDGAAMIQGLRPLNPCVKIIAASGLDSNDPMAKLSGTGVKHFLAKPYTPEPLLKLLRTVLDEK